MNIILILILASILALSVIFFLIFRKIRDVQNVFTQFITPADEKTPSALAKTAEIFSDMMARSVMAQAKSFLMGLQSGQKRAEAAIQGDIAQDLAGQGGNPLGAVLSSFPAVKKTLRRNPQLMDLALSYLANKVGTSGSGGPGPGNNHNDQVKFKL